jgi:DNA-binding MarR family transcriptional regulator
MTTNEHANASAVASQLLGATARLSKTVSEELEKRAGLPLGWFLVLGALAECEGCYMKMTELASKVSLTTSGATRVVDRMVGVGYLERRDCERDRRVSYAALTESGSAAYCRCQPVFARSVGAFFDSRLGEGELTELEKAMAKLQV